MTFTTALLLAACGTNPIVQVPPLDEALREECVKPDQMPSPADMGVLLQFATRNASLVHECALRHSKVVKAYDKVQATTSGQ